MLDMWILIIPLVAFALISAVATFLALLSDRQVREWRGQYDQAIIAQHDMHAQQAKLRERYLNLLAQNADLREAWRECEASRAARQQVPIWLRSGNRRRSSE